MQDHADEEERVESGSEFLDVCTTTGAEWGEGEGEGRGLEVWDVYLVFGLGWERGEGEGEGEGGERVMNVELQIVCCNAQ